MRQYLAEGLTGAFPFIVDRTKSPVTESRPNGTTFHRIPGRFSVCDCVNGNNRRYSRKVWEKNLQSGSILQESIGRSAAFGLLEHPKDGIITLLSPISHHVTKAEMVESKDSAGNPIHEVIGEIALYNTEEGLKLKALIEGGYNPLVSSRGYGSLNKAADGVDEVQEDYICEGWDVVIKPSFENAQLTPNREPPSTTKAQIAAPAKPNPAAESVTTTSSNAVTVTSPLVTFSPVSSPLTESINYRGYAITAVEHLNWAGYRKNPVPVGDNDAGASFRVTTPSGNTWDEIAVNLATAKKWIDADLQ